MEPNSSRSGSETGAEQDTQTHGVQSIFVNRDARERELERKRTRGEVSCAECRRLKVRCDKKVPCTSCVRRGCPTICPNGVLAGGQGTRFVLANTDRLHKKLLEMSMRIRQLEDALQIAHGSLSSQLHPLLSEELLAVKAGIDAEKPNIPEEANQDGEVSGAFGTLTISEHGESQFMGRAGSEIFFMKSHDDIEKALREESTTRAGLPHQISFLYDSFPFSPLYLPREEIRKQIESRLPSFERATALIECYLENISYFFRPVAREQIMEDLMPMMYKHRFPGSSSRSESNRCDVQGDSLSNHQLALLLMIFACGALGDYTIPPGSDEAQLYKYLARATMSLNSIFGGSSMATVQSILLIGMYDFFSCRAISMEESWKLMSFGAILASSIGLHRDPARWNLNPKMVHRRRSLFWEICAVDNWKSLGTGRPAMFHVEETDCEFPEDRDATLSEDGTILPGFYCWKYQFTKDIVSKIAQTLSNAGPIKYTEVLELDRKIRDYQIRPLRRKISPADEASNLLNMQIYTSRLFNELALLFLHRSFFARAMLDSTSPLRSPFSPSFLAAFTSATKIIKAMNNQFEKFPQFLLRQWPMWAHALTSGVILGSVAVKNACPELVPAALKELDNTINLFEKAQIHPVAKNGLHILLGLRDKARKVHSDVSQTDSQGVKTENIDDELALLGGTPRFVKQTLSYATDGGLPAFSNDSRARGTNLHNFSNSTSNDAHNMPVSREAYSLSSMDTILREHGARSNASSSVLADLNTIFGSDASTLQLHPGHEQALVQPSEFPPWWAELGLASDPVTMASVTAFDSGLSFGQGDNTRYGNMITDLLGNMGDSLHSTQHPAPSLQQLSQTSRAPNLAAAQPSSLMSTNFGFETNFFEPPMDSLDPTVANAWRTLMEDPRFYSLGLHPNSFST